LSLPLLPFLLDGVGLGDGAASWVEVVTGGEELGAAGAAAFRNLAEEVVGEGEGAGASAALGDGFVCVGRGELETEDVTGDSPSSQSLSHPAPVRTSRDSWFKRGWQHLSKNEELCLFWQSHNRYRSWYSG
jgi:hypothetical protein